MKICFFNIYYKVEYTFSYTLQIEKVKFLAEYILIEFFLTNMESIIFWKFIFSIFERFFYVFIKNNLIDKNFHHYIFKGYFKFIEKEVTF